MNKSSILLLSSLCLFYSCKTLPGPVTIEPTPSHPSIPSEPHDQRIRQGISRFLTGSSRLTQEELVVFFMEHRPDADIKLVSRLASLYIKESSYEGINSDCAFAQMCLETGFLRFGNLVTKDMHNYCGLGSTGRGNPGSSFRTEQEGVRAHIQHLHAYATPESSVLYNPLIDPRYKFVHPRAKAPTIYELAGTWAMDTQYGKKLDKLLSDMEGYIQG